MSREKLDEKVASPAEYIEFKRRLDDNYAAWDTLNAEAAARFYSKGSEMVFYDAFPPLEGYTGWESIKANMQKNVLDTLSSLKQTANDDLRVWQRGDISWTTNTFRILGKRKSGEALEVVARHTFIWERRNGEWQEVHEHASFPVSAGTKTVPSRREDRAEPSVDAEFKQLVDNWFATWSTLSTDAAERFYAKDEGLVYYNVFPPLDGYVGWDELKAGQHKSFANLASARFTPYNDLRVWRRGDIVWTTNTFHVSTKSKDGKISEIDARVTLIWEQRDGRWLIAHEHLSTTSPG